MAGGNPFQRQRTARCLRSTCGSDHTPFNSAQDFPLAYMSVMGLWRGTSTFIMPHAAR
jgi:hypothetical protein